jgi:hypothetical protein
MQPEATAPRRSRSGQDDEVMRRTQSKIGAVSYERETT